MKLICFEEIENKTTILSKLFCPCCGNHSYIIHHQIQPEIENDWWVECESCGHESYPSPTREVAIARWKQGC